jgi:hypothetical protein
VAGYKGDLPHRAHPREQALLLARGRRHAEGVLRHDAITSAPPEKFDAAKLLTASRDHWSIENCQHYVRDVTFKEDASRIRTGALPEIMVALRSSVLGLIRRTGQKPTAARPAYAARPKAAIKLLMSS